MFATVDWRSARKCLHGSDAILLSLPVARERLLW
jgi:hypothetical protein